MNHLKRKTKGWPMHLLMLVTAYILLGSQNRLFRANDNWIYTGKGSTVVIGAIVFALLLLWGLLSIKRGKSLSKPLLYIDGLVVIVLLSCVVTKFTYETAIYLVVLLIGVLICEWIVFLKLEQRQVVTLVYWMIGCLAVIGTTNLSRLYFGWTLPFTEPQDWFHYESSERLSLWFGNPNDLGCVMAVGSILSVWLIEKYRSRFVRVAAIVLFCIFFKVLLETYSRGAMAGFVVGFMLYIARPGWKTRTIVPVLCIAVVILSSFGSAGGYSARLKSSANIQRERSISSRLIVWGESLKMIKHRPIFGAGLGNFGREFASQYHGSRKLPAYSTAMNNILTLGVECGLVSVLLYLMVIVAAVVAGSRATASKHSEYQDSVRVLVSALCVMVLCGLLTYSLCKPYYSISWVVVGLIVCIVEDRESVYCHNSQRISGSQVAELRFRRPHS